VSPITEDSALSPLPPGLYEQVVDRLLERRLVALRRSSIEVSDEELDAGDSHAVLADYLRRVVRESLNGVVGGDRLARQVALVNRILRELEATDPDGDRWLITPPRRLLGVWPLEPLGGGKPERPDTPLALGSLLAGTRVDPSLVSQLRKELGSADRVDILCSFIKWSGIRILEDDLRAFTAKPASGLRVLTTSYLGATDLRAVDLLRSLPKTEVRVSYDTRRTRLHAKAYLFHRDSDFGSAYVGSANLSHPALTEGLEWTIKLSQYESPHLWNRVIATFETYWEDREFEPYHEADQPRLRKALQDERSVGSSAPEQFGYKLEPYAFQQEILDRLDAERRVQGRDRHLVVAATGTGKTMIAAFDYRHWSREQCSATGQRPRLLFIAHREELLRQSLQTYRDVLRDPNFGDLLVGGHEPTQHDHLFVSIQSYKSRSLDELPNDRYEYIVVDEFHHAAAPSYEHLLEHVQPRVLLGLTATPERADGLDVLKHFGGHISAQLRLPDAINRKLLSPFQYFAVTDNEDLSDLKWQRGGYRIEQRELLAYQLSRIDSVAPLPRLPFACPLTLHAPYTRDEVLAALGRWTRSEQPEMREGVLHLPNLRVDVFFVTLQKTEKDYSPTTMYQDYAINDRLFHWQSQSTTSAASPTGQRYIGHADQGYTILLFGREYKSRNGLAQPYSFLGPARYVDHRGSRPMSITWRLEHSLPARLLRTLARLAVA
jgi:HKD family nuclease